MTELTLNRAIACKESIARIDDKITKLKDGKYISFSNDGIVSSLDWLESGEKEHLLHFYRGRLADLKDELDKL